MSTEPELAAIARQHPGWECWVGVTGVRYARLPRSSPPIVVRGTDAADLARQIQAAAGMLARRQHPLTARPADQ
jgi:hypothetical protein